MESDLKEEVIGVLSNGDKTWKHLKVIHDGVKQDKQEVRDTIADLLDEGTVKVNMDPRNYKPIFALAKRVTPSK